MHPELQPTRYAYLDALRGYAILLVMAVHTSQLVPDQPRWLSLPLSQGARGVQLFFVVSAVTLCMSWSVRNDGAKAFYVRRLFRIAPMFWLAIIFFWLTKGHEPSEYAPDGISAKHVILTATFLHGMLPDTLTSVVPGGWSIADEMLFYAIFPLLIAICRSKQSTVILLCVALVADLLIYSVIEHFAAQSTGLLQKNLRIFSVLNFFHQLPVFIFGMLTYRIIENRQPIERPEIIALAMTFVIYAIVIAVAYTPIPSFWSILIFGAIFSCGVLALSKWPHALLVNVAICWIGKISFSAYLIHFAILPVFPEVRTEHPILDWMIVFVGIGISTIALSSLTYTLIERRFVRLGNLIVAARYHDQRKLFATAAVDPTIGI